MTTSHRPCPTRASLPSTGARAAGFALISVLVSVIIICVGLLGLLRAMITTTNGVTDNQTLAQIATASNGFWGVVQAARPITSTSTSTLMETLPGTYTSANIATAPAALQPWLTQTLNNLPGGQVQIATAADQFSGTACSTMGSSGCFVTLTIGWAGGAGSNAAARQQVFYYQFGGL